MAGRHPGEVGTVSRAPREREATGVARRFSGSPVEGVISVVKDAAGELLVVVTRRDLSPTARILKVVPVTWADLGGALAGTAGEPRLVGSGELGAGATATLALSDAAPQSAVTLVVGAAWLGVPFKGGVMLPSLDVLLQGLVTGPGGFAASNAVAGTTW